MRAQKNAQTHTFMDSGGNELEGGDRPESTGGGGGEEGDDERGGGLGGRGQRESGGERIRL